MCQRRGTAPPFPATASAEGRQLDGAPFLSPYEATGQVTAVDDTFGPQLGITALIAPSSPPAAMIMISSGRSTTGI